MADVFISYARTERAKAERIRELLESAGLSVFFDVLGLDGGDVFPDVLDREVKSAGCVLGLWSPYALSRSWIRTECLIGKDRGVLVPVLIEPLDPLRDVPAAFYGVQTIDLATFTGAADSAEWRQLMRAIARVLKRPELSPKRVGEEKPGAFVAAMQNGRRRAGSRIVPVAAGLALLVTAAAALWLFDPLKWKTSAIETAEAPIVEDGAPQPDATSLLSEDCPPMSAMVFFEWQSATLSASAREALQTAVTQAASECIIHRVTVTGHEDLVAPPDFALEISRRRAAAVAEALIGLGISSALVTTEGRGNAEPAVPTAPGVREPQNRRVEVKLERWPGQDTEAFDMQTASFKLTEALPRLLAGRHLSDSALDHAALLAGLTAVAGIEYITLMADERVDFATVAGWAYAEGLGVETDPRRAAGYFKLACEANEPAGCIGFGRMVGQGVSGLPLSEARQVMERACASGVSEACATR